MDLDPLPFLHVAFAVAGTNDEHESPAAGGIHCAFQSDTPNRRQRSKFQHPSSCFRHQNSTRHGKSPIAAVGDAFHFDGTLSLPNETDNQLSGTSIVSASA